MSEEQFIKLKSNFLNIFFFNNCPFKEHIQIQFQNQTLVVNNYNLIIAGFENSPFFEIVLLDYHSLYWMDLLEILPKHE